MVFRRVPHPEQVTLPATQDVTTQIAIAHIQMADRYVFRLAKLGIRFRALSNTTRAVVESFKAALSVLKDREPTADKYPCFTQLK